MFENQSFNNVKTNKTLAGAAKYLVRFAITIITSYFLLIQFLVLSTILNYLSIYDRLELNYAYDLDLLIRLCAVFLSPIILYIYFFSRDKVTFHIYLIAFAFGVLNLRLIDCYENCMYTIILNSILFGIAANLLHFGLIKFRFSVLANPLANTLNRYITNLKEKAPLFLGFAKIACNYFISSWIFLNLTIILAILISLEKLAGQYDVYEAFLKIFILFFLPILYIVMFSRDKFTFHPYLLNLLFFSIIYSFSYLPLIYILILVFISTSIIEVIHLMILGLTKFRRVKPSAS